MGILHLVQTEDEAVQQQLGVNMAVLRHLIARDGGLRLSDETVDWTALDQYSGQTVPLRLPGMWLGNHWLGQNPDPDVLTPVLDDAAQITQGPVTIFQQMNENGDMLRVATTIQDAEGRRAIGTYIPAKLPDGTPNPVISEVLQGRTYHGRAFVLNAWHLAIYEPLRNEQGVPMPDRPRRYADRLDLDAAGPPDDPGR